MRILPNLLADKVAIDDINKHKAGENKGLWGNVIFVRQCWIVPGVGQPRRGLDLSVKASLCFSLICGVYPCLLFSEVVFHYSARPPPPDSVIFGD